MAPTTVDGLDIDDATIDGTEVSEITVDGNVVFKAVSDIPDSGANHQWNFVEGSGTTVNDEIGSLDADFTGLSWGSSEGANETHGVLDGTDDYAILDGSSSSMAHFVNDQEGSILSWINPDSFTDDDNNSILASNISGSNRSFYFVLDDDSGELQFGIGDGSQHEHAQADTAVNTDEWSAVMGSVENGTIELYIAQPPDYDVTSVGSHSLSFGTTSGDLNQEVSLGNETSDGGRYYDGGIDITFVDSSPWSESDFQQFVEDSKHLYE